MNDDVLEFLRSRERACYEAWLASGPEHTAALALKWHKALRALDNEMQARTSALLRRCGVREVRT